MFSHESTDNLLDNLESELTEMIELETPKRKIATPEKQQSPKTEKREPPPVPRFWLLGLTPQIPVPLTRRVNSLDKIEKNNENEIIQLQSLNSENEGVSSESQKLSQASSKHNTVIRVNERENKESINKVRVVHEAERMPSNDTFFVIKHGKWADGDDKTETELKIQEESSQIEKEIMDGQVSVIEAQKPAEVLVIDERATKKIEKKKKSAKKKKESTTSSITTSLSTSSSESSSEPTPQPKKRTKKHKSKLKHNKKSSKNVSEDLSAASVTEDSASKKGDEKMDVASSNKAISIYVSNCGPMKYRKEIKGLKIKISFYNEDNGKQIGDTMWTKSATYNNDFHNFMCFWKENIKASYDFKRLREIYNNILIFFEVINGDNVPVFWAFIKLFSPNSVNIDKKFKLQCYEYQNPSNSCFSIFSKSRNSNQIYTIFDQWQMARKKLEAGLNIYLKDVNLTLKDEEIEKQEDVKVNRIQVLCANENSNRHWRKIPGQACKVPNKILQKIPLHGKGSLMAKFSHDGNYLAFTEISKNGHLLYIYKFPQMTEAFVMLEHSDIVHDLDWRKQKNYNCNYLVSASADFSANVWRIQEDSYTYTILPHPSFVYASKFLQKDDIETITVVTACRDNFIRIWKNRHGMESFELCQELRHPKTSTYTYITSIVTRNFEAFYSSSSTGDVIEWIVNDSNEYSLNRLFKVDEMHGKIIQNMEMNPRGNKICLRLHDSQSNEVSSAIFVLGIATGTLTQKFSQINLQNDCQGRLRISPCGTHIYSTNGPRVQYYQMTNGSIVAAENSHKKCLTVNFCLGEKGFISSIDYHPKDFFLVCSVYGGSSGEIIVFSYETDQIKDPIETMKMGSQEAVLQKSLESRQIGSYSDIIKRMDEVFLAPLTAQNGSSEILNVQEFHQAAEDNTFTIQTNSKRSKTYTVSQGPATFTIQKGGTYEIQKNDGSDDDETTISESLN